MPIYEYRCENGHSFEVLQAMSDDPVEACEDCGAPVERVFHPVAVHFKGSGFYTTDYANKRKPGDGESKGGDSGSGEGKSESSPDSGSSSDSKKSDSKKSDSGTTSKAASAD